MNNRLIYWLIDLSLDCWIVWLIDWFTDWFTDWLIDWLIYWLIDWLTDWLTGWLVDWLDLSQISFGSYLFTVFFVFFLFLGISFSGVIRGSGSKLRTAPQRHQTGTNKPWNVHLPAQDVQGLQSLQSTSLFPHKARRRPIQALPIGIRATALLLHLERGGSAGPAAFHGNVHAGGQRRSLRDLAPADGVRTAAKIYHPRRESNNRGHRSHYQIIAWCCCDVFFE